MAKRHLPVGIDDMAAYVPSLYLDIRDLAEARSIQYEKLASGLGLLKMAFPDVHEDAATMAAEAISELMEKNGLRPEQIGRVYLGTESALDGAKPTATYAVEMVQQRLGGSFRHCDVVDMTFACIAATDALQNCLDWVAGDRERVAIVVASDFAKYESDSTGEYTQGAGAVAVLVKWYPRLLVIPRQFGVAMDSVHDFYKPRRKEFTETPIFDGPFSNQCYQDRMTEALAHFREVAGAIEDALSDRWERMAFHLPYSFHAKRIYLEVYAKEMMAKGVWDVAPDAKIVSQSPEYKAFVERKLEKAQRASSLIGNLYTGSVFMALMSTLDADAREGNKLTGKRIGLIAYGSGSKSKVFEGIVQKGWAEVANKFQLMESLENRKAIDYSTYEQLHHHLRQHSVFPQEGRFALQSIGIEGTVLGARYYGRFHLNGRAVVKRPAEKLEAVS
ncbi:MAG: hydroxymethylglutaryl-CoA synthase family protein [Saprospiraceae bacterium]|nr:hydroxymethylglutaryl-CoA synthase family protein [Saprospiraceae bacterium]